MGAVLSVCRSLRWPCPLRCRYVFGPSERCSLLDVVHVEHRQASGPRQLGLAQSLFLVPLFPVPCSLIQAMGCRETFARLSRMPSRRRRHLPYVLDLQPRLGDQAPDAAPYPADRKSVVSGKSVSVRVDLGGRRIIKKQKVHNNKKTTSCIRHNIITTDSNN